MKMKVESALTSMLLILYSVLILLYQIEAKKNIFCYYTNWAQYRPSEWAFRPEHLNAHICTHYIFAFAVIDDSTFRIKPYEWNDEDQSWGMRGMYSRFVENVRKGNGKALLAVGGWNFGMRTASIMMADPRKRAIFIKSSLELLKKYGFDGLDVDFEYPNNQDTGGNARDRLNFLLLLKELRDAFNQQMFVSRTGRSYILSAAVAPLPNRANRAYTPGQLAKYVDFISIMAYDMHGAWERTVGFNAPLLSSSNRSSPFHDWSLQSAVLYWANHQRFPVERINVGLPLYGRSFKLLNSPDIRPYYALNRGPGTAGPSTREAGVLSYVEIMDRYSPGNRTRRLFDWERMVPYVADQMEWVTYDDLESLILKVELSKCYNLGGIMFWALDYDDFHGHTTDSAAGTDKTYPLIRGCRAAAERPVWHEFCDLVG